MSSVHTDSDQYSSSSEGDEGICMPHGVVQEDDDAGSGISAGERQSPIDLADHDIGVVKPNADSFIKNYKPAPATITYDSNHVEWTGDAGGIVINGTEYKLDQCHWHIPAEHTFNGTTRYDMEMHIVHTNSSGDNAVIGVLYKFGAPDPFLQQLYPHIISGDDNEKGTDVGIVDPFDIHFDSKKYYRYNGSLTTSPFSENVVWTVIKKVSY
ncbi:hypothetical protein RD792_012631 [Penstemon davidsonii]|uniref:Alpha-carbonic anhydrase domain-containing protein n=1 Tax=Penstemon davidsonii TaxID=160366 RepID=A0ABR0CXE9_9LAMI|nr:hypothetical protein RD792_012631 [Penstemon davidsonii]